MFLRASTLVSLLSLMLPAIATEYQQSWGPQKDAPLPILQAPNQLGTTQSFDDLKGKNGLLLFMNRSADW